MFSQRAACVFFFERQGIEGLVLVLPGGQRVSIQVVIASMRIHHLEPLAAAIHASIDALWLAQGGYQFAQTHAKASLAGADIFNEIGVSVEGAGSAFRQRPHK